MQIYFETVFPDGSISKTWNYCHPSGYAGCVVEAFYKDGNIGSISFSTDGKYHRPVSEGPAYKLYDAEGYCIDEEFWVNGHRWRHKPPY